jgi:predicted phage-related endonuclease
MNTTHAIVIHDLVQGSREWHVYRAEHLNASDASAMLGSSPYQTRDELKQRLHTGLAADVDPRTQARYDNGHRIEALARPLGEDVLCDELVPMVVSRGKFSASLDGAVPFATPTVIRFTRLWEHKQLNDALRAAMVEGATGADLPKPYRVQMEQQLFCTDAEDVLFTASDWDGDTLIEARHVVYVSDPDLREEILAGWQLLEEEMVSYVPPTAGAIVIARTYAAMPSLKFDVSGDLQIKHNLGVYLQALETFAAAAPKKPSTDQEFADADSAGKKGRDIAVVARTTKADLLRRVGSLNEAMGVLDEIEALGDKLGLAQEKVVKLRKEEVKAEMTKAARDLLAAEVDSLNAELGEELITPIGHVVGEFAEAVKNKRSFDSMQASINEALAALKISYRQRAILLHTNLDTLGTVDEKHRHLFSDKAAILTKAPDDFAALVKVRCSEFDSAEAVRVETEKKRIQASAQQAAAAQVQRAHAQTRAALNGADVAVCDQTITTLEAQIFEEEAYGAHCQALAESRDQVLQVARSAREAAVTKTATAVAEAPAPGPAPAPAAAPAAVTTAPAPAVAPSVVALPQRVAPAAGTPPTLSLGKLGTRLGFNLTADFLRSIGFEPAGRERAAVLYHEADFGHICAALVGHIQALQSKQAA